MYAIRSHTARPFAYPAVKPVYRPLSARFVYPAAVVLAAASIAGALAYETSSGSPTTVLVAPGPSVLSIPRAQSQTAPQPAAWSARLAAPACTDGPCLRS